MLFKKSYQVWRMRSYKSAFAVATCLFNCVTWAELQPEPLGLVETLPTEYPDHWIMVHDGQLSLEGKIQIVDPLAPTTSEQVKGMLTASLVGASYQWSNQRHEHYVAETFYSRNSRGGERTDVLAIYDSDSLTLSGEIVLPPKRVSGGAPKRTHSGLTPDERFMMLYNFTPAQSVSVVDLEARAFVAEIETPGCALVLPNGDRNFTSICSNGMLRTTHLDGDGKMSGYTSTEVLFDPNVDPIFEHAAITNGTAHFPTFEGRVLPINLSLDTVSAGGAWWLSGMDERNWRPGGLLPVTADSAGLGYFLMNPAGADGTQDDGGSEVWVFDLIERKRLGRIALENWGLALGTSGSGKNRLLAVTAIGQAGFQVDIYRIPSGEFVHTLGITMMPPVYVYGLR